MLKTKTEKIFIYYLRMIKTNSEDIHMLYWSLTFLIIAIVAGLMGFRGIEGIAATIAKVLFIVFLILFIITMVSGYGMMGTPQP